MPVIDGVFCLGMYTDPSYVSVTLEWSEIMGNYNTPDIAVRDRRLK